MGLVCIPLNGLVGNVGINLLSSINRLLANFVSIGLDTKLQCKVVMTSIVVVLIGVSSIVAILDAWAEEHFVSWVKHFFLTSVLICTIETCVDVARPNLDGVTIMKG